MSKRNRRRNRNRNPLRHEEQPTTQLIELLLNAAACQPADKTREAEVWHSHQHLLDCQAFEQIWKVMHPLPLCPKQKIQASAILCQTEQPNIAAYTEQVLGAVDKAARDKRFSTLASLLGTLAGHYFLCGAATGSIVNDYHRRRHEQDATPMPQMPAGKPN